MALLGKLKNLFSNTDKEILGTAKPEEAAQKSSFRPDASKEAAPPEPADDPEPEMGTEAYLLYEFKQKELSSAEDMKSSNPEVSSAMKAIRARLELAERYARQEAEGTAAAKEEEMGNAAQAINPEEAEIKVFASRDQMTGFLYCLPPVGKAAQMTEEGLCQAISEYGIQHGIDQDAISRIGKEKLYCRIFAIARGTPPVKGKDGEIIDHFPRNKEFDLKEDERGNIDYKNAGIFRSVKKGEVICEIIPPEDGTAGTDIMGNSIPAKRGEAPSVPRGKNTRISEGGSALIADSDGDISFQGNVFRVESKLVISQNVDNTTGNIDFAGDIVIYGDIMRGFHVTAGGSLAVHGLVEGATLAAGEDITLLKGMNGSSGGSLAAGGTVRSHFLEQTKVVADGDVVSDVMINCDIQSGGSILATSKKGIIIGGTLKASQSVIAKRIGNQSETHTVIEIGVPIDKKENIKEVAGELKNAVDTLDKITKNYNYLNHLPSIPDKYKEMYGTLAQQKGVYEELVEKLQGEIEILQNKKINYSACYVHGDVIYSITEVTFKNFHINVRDTTSKCSVYFSQEKGDLVIGTF